MHLKTRPSLFLSLRATLLHRLRRWDEQPALVLYSSLQYKEKLKILDTLWASPPLCASSFSSPSSSYSGAASKNDSSFAQREGERKNRRRAQAQPRTRCDGERRTLATAHQLLVLHDRFETAVERKSKRNQVTAIICSLKILHKGINDWRRKEPLQDVQAQCSPIVPCGRTEAHGWSSFMKTAAVILWCTWTSSFTLSKL